MWYRNSKKLNVIFKSYYKNIKFEDYYHCLIGGEYEKECDKFFLFNLPRKVSSGSKKNYTTQFDDKRCYINETESKPWKLYY